MEKLYLSVANDILKRMNEGDLKPGDKLLTEKELCHWYHVSRTTIRSALKQSAVSSKLRRVKGSGTYVASMESINRTTLFMNSFAAELKQRGISVVTEVIEFRWLILDEDFPELHLAAGDRTVKLTRLRYGKGCFDSGPVVYTISYFPPAIGEKLMLYNLENMSVHDVFQKYGINREFCTKNLSAAQLSPMECRIAGEEENALFISVISTTYDEKNNPVEYSKSYYPVRRNSFEIIA